MKQGRDGKRQDKGGKECEKKSRERKGEREVVWRWEMKRKGVMILDSW